MRESALAFARRLIAEKAPLRKVRDRSDKLEPARGHPEIFETIRKANARKFRGFEAWEKAIESVKNAVDLPFDEGIVKERADVHGALADDAVQGAAARVLRRAAGGEGRRHRPGRADEADHAASA